ncbi:MAG: type II toxin-antitoxin system RelE/ParE family toxin [Bacteroidetes bacterium]|nr:type II toxin-antitoxin system RelE/ParE family toxin [Bacteroidota bacterium]
MIISFKDKITAQIWDGKRVKEFATDIQNRALVKMRLINQAENITDLKNPPGNNLEKLSGNLKGYYSVRVNEKYRIIFQWNAGNASNAQLIDYH